MPDTLSKDIRECYRHAEELARRAEKTSDPSLKQDYLNVAQRWLDLARSYEFTERLTRLRFNKRKR